MNRSKRLTYREIAAKAGLKPETVARYLRGDSGRKSTALLVEAALAELASEEPQK